MVEDIPQDQRVRLNQTLGDAEAFAAMGLLATGFTRLMVGLRQAETDRVEGAAWGEALVRRYRAEMDSYTARYHLR